MKEPFRSVDPENRRRAQPLFGVGKESFEDARMVPDIHLRILASGMMPPDVCAVGSIYTAGTGRDFNFLQNAYWSAPVNSAPLLKEHRDDSYKIGVRFGRLILIVAYYPSNDYAYGINSKACFSRQ